MAVEKVEEATGEATGEVEATEETNVGVTSEAQRKQESRSINSK